MFQMQIGRLEYYRLRCVRLGKRNGFIESEE